MLPAVPALSGGLLSPNPITDFVVTGHAALELSRRGLSRETIRQILANPEQQEEIRPGRIVLQSRTNIGTPAKEFLIRVFVDVDRKPAKVVTAYRTSKVAKYWREGP
jgi:hypothetical protein